jgi:hypothetical protein|tara:strand:- start:3475 stop:3687 length:213 start_codon:yes stop_codon:yes gene_type:complete
MMKKVKDHKHLYRTDTGAVVNNDTTGYNEYVKMRSNRDRQKQELDEMRKDIDEIKSLLTEFINGSRSNQT